MCTGDDRGGIEIFKRQTALIIDLVFTTVLFTSHFFRNNTLKISIIEWCTIIEILLQHLVVVRLYFDEQ